jgi:hypothetical protein
VLGICKNQILQKSAFFHLLTEKLIWFKYEEEKVNPQNKKQQTMAKEKT